MSDFWPNEMKHLHLRHIANLLERFPPRFATEESIQQRKDEIKQYRDKADEIDPPKATDSLNTHQ